MARGGRRCEEDLHVTCLSGCRKRAAPSGEWSDGSAQAENRLEDRGYASTSRRHETATVAMRDGFATAQTWKSRERNQMRSADAKAFIPDIASLIWASTERRKICLSAQDGATA